MDAIVYALILVFGGIIIWKQMYSNRLSYEEEQRALQEAKIQQEKSSSHNENSGQSFDGMMFQRDTTRSKVNDLKNIIDKSPLGSDLRKNASNDLRRLVEEPDLYFKKEWLDSNLSSDSEARLLYTSLKYKLYKRHEKERENH